MFDFDLLADLPAPRDDEPPSLRDDIHDELADHLTCAYRREVLKDGDEAAAEERVIDRFGDPKKLARRLWWQAMWSRIMGQRILSGLQWMLTLAAVVLAGLVFRQQSELLNEIQLSRQERRHDQEVLTTAINRLVPVNPAATQSYVPGDPTAEAKPSRADGQEYDLDAPIKPKHQLQPVTSDIPESHQSLTVKLVQETAEGPEITDAKLVIEVGGHTLKAKQIGPLDVMEESDDGQNIVRRIHGPTGQYLFNVPKPDRYRLEIRLADGQFCEQSVLIRPNEKRKMTVVCPKPREQALVTLIAPPLPQELQAVNCELEIQLNDQTMTVDGVEWLATSPNLQRVKFDPQEGSIVEIQNQANGETTGLRRSKPEERAIVLLSGPVRYSYQIAPRVDRGANVFGAVAVTEWPEDGSVLTHEIAPGETQWKLELPEELLAEAKRRMSTSRPVSNPAAYAPVTNDEMLEAEAVTPGEGAALTVKLVQETADGPPVSRAQLRLEGRYGRIVGRELSQPVTVTHMEDGKAISEVVPRATGEYLFQVQEPGRYQLKIQLADGQSCEQPILLRSKEHHERTVICPKPREQALVTLTAPPLPKVLQAAKCELEIVLNDGITTVDGIDWRSNNANHQRVTFDPQGGLAVAIRTENGETTNLRRSKPEERAVVMLSGPVQYSYHVSPQIGAFVGSTSVAVWPDDGSSLTQDIAPGEDQWQLELPDELLKEAGEMFVRGKARGIPDPANVKPPGVPEPVEDTAPDDSSGAKTDADDKGAVLTIKLVQETANGPAVTDAKVSATVSGRTFRAKHIGALAVAERADDGQEVAKEVHGDTGQYVFHFPQPNRYEIKIALADGQYCEQSVLARSNEHRELTVVCPGPQKKAMVYLTCPPLPEELRALKCDVTVTLDQSVVKVGGIEWRTGDGKHQSVTFDPQGGHVVEIREEHGAAIVDLGNSKPEDRAVMLLSGPVQYRYYLAPPVRSRVATWPKELLTHEIEPGENHWELELPDELLKKARNLFVRDESSADPAPMDEEQVGASEAQTKADGKGATLIVKLVEEGEDGSAVTGAKVTLEKSGTVIKPKLTPMEKTGGDRLSQNSGGYGFQNLIPERYTLRVELADGQHSERSVLIRRKGAQELTIVCPKPREKALVFITGPQLSEQFQKPGTCIKYAIEELPIVLNGVNWQLPEATRYRVDFDSQTRQPGEVDVTSIIDGNEYGSPNIDLSESSPEERAVFLLTGPVKASFLDYGPAGEFDSWPHPDADFVIRYTVSPEDNRWELDLTPQAKRFLNGELPADQARRAQPVEKTEAPGESTGAKTEAHDKPAVLCVKLVEGKEDGPPVLGAMAELRWGQFYREQREETRPFQPRFSEDGIPFGEVFEQVKGNVFRFPGLKPERYSLTITLVDGQTCEQKVLIRDEKPKELTVICPAAREKAPVVMSVTPLPDDLREADFRVWCLLTPMPLELENSKWLLRKSDTEGAPSTPIDFGASGRPEFIDHTEFSPETPLEDRVAFLPQGPYYVRVKIYQVGQKVDLWDVSKWPKLDGNDVTRTVNPGENRWELELSEEMIAAARKQLADGPDESSEKSPATATGFTPEGKPKRPEKTVRASDDEPLGEQCRWIVKLTSETADGPAPKGARLELRDDAGEFAWVRDENGATAQTDLQLGPDGTCVMGPIDPGRYTLDIHFPDGRHAQKKLPLLRSGQERTEHVICPPEPKKAVVNVSVTPVPQELQHSDLRLIGSLEMKPVVELDGVPWQLPGFTRRLMFDQQTGLPTALIDRGAVTTDLSQAAPEDRAIVVLSGAYDVSFEWQSEDLTSGLLDVTVTKWPHAATTDLKPGDNEWKIEVPEKLLKRIKSGSQRNTNDQNAADEPLGTDPSPPQNKPDEGLQKDQHEDQSANDIGSGQITIVAKRETPDGPAVPNLQFPIYPMNGGKRQPQLFSTQTDAEGKATITDLEPGRYEIVVGMPNGGCDGSFDFRVQSNEKATREVVVPAVKRVPTKITASLPKELEAAGFRVCVLLQPESPTRNEVQLHVRQPDGMNWRAPYLIGPEGTGLLQIGPGVNIRRKTRFSGRPRWSEGNPATVELPDVRLHVASLSLIRPQTSADEKNETEKTSTTETMWETHSQLDDSSFQSEFLPVPEQINEWQIRIPDELIFAAEKTLRKTK